MAASSLRARARLLIGLGIASLVLLGTFQALVQDQVIGAERDLVTVRQLDADHHGLAEALATQQAALRAYTSALPFDDRLGRGLGRHGDLLNEYAGSAGASAAAVQRLRRDAARAGVDVEPAAAAATAWEMWAAQRRSAAEASAGRLPTAAVPADSDGDSLYAAFTAADRVLGERLSAGERAATEHARSVGADDARVFYAVLAVEAGALLLLGVAMLVQVLRPLGRLTDAAADLAAGRPAAVPYQERGDEVGSLARALTLWQRSSAEMFRVFQRSPIGIARLDAAGGILEANPAFEQMVGVAPGTIGGRNLVDLAALAGRQELLARVRSVATGESESLALEARLLRHDASEFWAELTLSGVPLEDGERYLLAMVENVDVRKRQELELRHRAAHDALTGIPNRSLFDDRLNQALRAARRRRGTLAVLVIDLDRFKPVNDELGHHAGDEVLRQVARRLRGALRESDTVARLGGDEFGVILPDQDAAGARRTLSKLRRAVAPPYAVGGEERSVGMSVGASVFPSDGRDGASLMATADRAMYADKRRVVSSRRRLSRATHAGRR